MAERRRYNKAVTVGKPATPGSSASSMAPHTDMKSTTPVPLSVIPDSQTQRLKILLKYCHFSAT